MMDVGTFWAAAAGMALAVLVVLIQALRRGRMLADEVAGRADLRVYRDQLAEIERDIARGTLPADEAARLRTEVSRRLLAADREAAGPGAAGPGGAGPGSSGPGSAMRRGTIAPAVAATVLAVGAAVATYAWLGVPGYPDLPLATRHALSDQLYAGRPSQAEAEAAAPVRAAPQIEPSFADLMTRLRAAVAARPDDQRGLELLARNEAALGNYGAAKAAQAALIAAKGAGVTAADRSALAEAMILAAGGIVTPEAEAVLVAALQQDPNDGTARYYSGLMFAQVGRTDRTFALWRPLLEDSAPDAPWVTPIRARIEAVAEAAGIRYALPAAGPGPSAGDVAASADMTPEARQAMIEGMVGQLADRLATDGGPAADWARLITSLAVLGQEERARAILAEARGRFAGVPADRDAIEAAAVQAGLAP